MQIQEIEARARIYYHQVNGRSRGLLDIISHAVQRFTRVQGAEAAAAIAYYTIFSIFPLLLVLTSVSGFVLTNRESSQVVVDFLTQFAPISPELIENTFTHIIHQRTASGIIGLVGVIFAASAMFKTLVRNINRAWPEARSLGVVRGQLVSILMVFSLATLMIFWVLGTSSIRILSHLPSWIPPEVQNNHTITRSLTTAGSWLVTFLIFFAMYYWLPYTHVRSIEAFWGALIATLAWKLATTIFIWVLNSGWANFNVLYGSLGTSLALLVWVYFTAVITLIGAHISAAIARVKRVTQDHDATRVAIS